MNRTSSRSACRWASTIILAAANKYRSRLLLPPGLSCVLALLKALQHKCTSCLWIPLGSAHCAAPRAETPQVMVIKYISSTWSQSRITAMEEKSFLGPGNNRYTTSNHLATFNTCLLALLSKPPSHTSMHIGTKHPRTWDMKVTGWVGLAPVPPGAPHVFSSWQCAQHKHTSDYRITYLVSCDKAGGNLIENDTALRIKRRSPFSC